MRLLIPMILVLFGCAGGTEPSLTPFDQPFDPDPTPTPTPTPNPNPSPPPGDPDDPARVATVSTAKDDGNTRLYSTAWGGQRIDVLRALGVPYNVIDYKISRSRQYIAAHIENLDTGKQEMHIAGTAGDSLDDVTPPGATTLADFGFARDRDTFYVNSFSNGLATLSIANPYIPGAAVLYQAHVYNVLFGIWPTMAGLLFRQDKELYLWEWDGTITLLSTMGDKSILARPAVKGDWITYSQHDLFAINIRHYVDTSILDVFQVSTEGGTGEVRGDKVKIVENMCVFPRDRVLYSYNFFDRTVPQQVPNSLDAIDWGVSRRGDALWFKTGLGSVWAGTLFGPTYQIVDTTLADTPKFNVGRNLIGVTNSPAFSGPSKVTVSLLDGSHRVDINLDGRGAWDFAKGMLPGLTGTPIFWGSNESGEGPRIKSGTVEETNGSVVLTAGLSWGLNDNLRIESVAFHRNRWTQGNDPTEAVVATTSRNGYRAFSFGISPGVEKHFAESRSMGFEGKATPLGYTTGTQLAPLITLQTVGALLHGRASFNGFGITWNGVAYEKEVFVSIDATGRMTWLEIADGPLAVFQRSNGKWELIVPKPRFVLIDDGFPGQYEAVMNPQPSPLPNVIDLFFQWGTNNYETNIYFPNSVDKTTGFLVTLAFITGLS